MSSWLARIALGSVALLQCNFDHACDILKHICKEASFEHRFLPAWLSCEAIAALAWANYATAIIGIDSTRDQHEVVPLLGSSLRQLPCYSLLHQQLASCLLREGNFSHAMCAMHCALCF